MREILNELVGTELIYPPGLDAFLVGVAFRAGSPAVPCYDYRKALRKKHLQLDMGCYPRVAWLLPLGPGNTRYFWDQVGKREMFRWEQLDKAITGIVLRFGAATAYDERAALEILEKLIEPTPMALQKLLELQQVNVGRRTPYFIRRPA